MIVICIILADYYYYWYVELEGDYMYSVVHTHILVHTHREREDPQGQRLSLVAQPSHTADMKLPARGRPL